MEILTKEQAFGADKAAMARGVAEETLVKNAGFAAACFIMRRYKKRPVFVMCGTGNNAADGLVIARTLALWGYPVTVADNGAPEKFSLCRATLTHRFGGKRVPLSRETVEKALRQNALFVEAVFGIGLNRPVDDDLQDIFDFLNDNDADVVAVDVPAGVDADTGAFLSTPPLCRATVTFCRPKPAHFLYPAKKYAGETVVADIGINDDDVARQNPFLRTAEKPASLTPDAQTHKYRRGAVLVAGGDMTGAAVLCATAALNGGAGWVEIACSSETKPVYAAYPSFVLTTNDFAAAATDKKVKALAVGMGLGDGAHAKNVVESALKSGKPVVLDADALRFINDADLSRAVLTPHDGEFSRAFCEFDNEPSKIKKAIKAARKTKAVVVLKGPDTVIAAPDGTAVVNTETTPFLATAGSGDVLSGLIAAELARGTAPAKAAEAAVWRHAHALIGATAPFTAEDLAHAAFF